MEALQEAAGEFLQERWAQLIVAFLFAGVGAFITTLRNRRKTADRLPPQGGRNGTVILVFGTKGSQT
jgi:hypothetical protein